MADRGVVLASVKGRMQALRDELDTVKDNYDLKCRECEALIEEKNQVCENQNQNRNVLPYIDILYIIVHCVNFVFC